MLTKIYPNNPDYRLIGDVIHQLEAGKVIIYPTGVGYALGCSAMKQRAVERVCQIKGIDSRRHTLAVMCLDLAEAATYAKISDTHFSLIKSGIYEPATYILPTTGQLPAIFRHRKEVGIRLATHPTTKLILESLEAPLLTGSLPDLREGVDPECQTHPELIEEYYGHQVDMIIDAGSATGGHSSVIDCTGSEPIVVREASSLIVD